MTSRCALRPAFSPPQPDAHTPQMRPLAASDYARGHFELLTVLTVAPALSKEDYASACAALFPRDRPTARPRDRPPVL